MTKQLLSVFKWLLPPAVTLSKFWGGGACVCFEIRSQFVALAVLELTM
jgi:hypothetical protein